MPLKRAVIPLLDSVSETAASVDAVNTVVLTEDGRRRGDNTDIPGIVAALREHGIEKAETAAVLGAGATASSALAALARICTGEITVYVRSATRADEMRGWAQRLDVDVRIANWPTPRAACAPRWSWPPPRPAPPTPWPPPSPSAPAAFFDVLYDPWPTALAARWSAYGGAVVSGLDLLLHQAVLQVEQMTGRAPAPLAAMRKAGERALADR
ncbi:shikimate dehydrogenase [Streptomyces violaceorubidus]